MNYFIIMKNVAVVPKGDQIYIIQKCWLETVSSYLTQAKNPYGQDSYYVFCLFD